MSEPRELTNEIVALIEDHATTINDGAPLSGFRIQADKRFLARAIEAMCIKRESALERRSAELEAALDYAEMVARGVGEHVGQIALDRIPEDHPMHADAGFVTRMKDYGRVIGEGIADAIAARLAALGAITVDDGGRGRATSFRPPIVCLCGSTRFAAEFMVAQFNETIAGRIVLTVGCFPRKADGSWDRAVVSDEQKVQLDALHFRKIEMADEVFVVNVGGYVGESTAREIAHARSLGKPIRWWDVAVPPATPGKP